MLSAYGCVLYTNPVVTIRSVLPSIEFTPIGLVHSSVHQPVDDVWGDVRCRIDLDPSRFTPGCLRGLTEFSHIEIAFVFHRVHETEITTGARRPRGCLDWPEVGIFAQRGKNRPNRIGLTVCQLLLVDHLSLHVMNLDAIDGTPVLDIKPYLREFGPRGEIRQPPWATQLMSTYWNTAESGLHPNGKQSGE
jgi:tRNA (adenine37-N6)-methyltransferase